MSTDEGSYFIALGLDTFLLKAISYPLGNDTTALCLKIPFLSIIKRTTIASFLKFIAQTKNFNHEVSKSCLFLKNTLQKGVKYFSEVKHHVQQYTLCCQRKN